MPNIIEIQDLNSEELDIYGRFSESRLLNLYDLMAGFLLLKAQKLLREHWIVVTSLCLL